MQDSKRRAVRIGEGGVKGGICYTARWMTTPSEGRRRVEMERQSTSFAQCFRVVAASSLGEQSSIEQASAQLFRRDRMKTAN
jgi:hypothetical protein